jgi:hypothetical protein
LPEFDDIRDVYVEFNLAAKLAGSFEETATLLHLGGRALHVTQRGASSLNLPHIENGEGLVTPLNVLVGGQTSPTDSAPPPKSLAAYKAEDFLDDEMGRSGAR